MNVLQKCVLLSLSQVVSIALSVLSSIVLYRAMGTHGTGQFNLFRTVGTFAAALAVLGCGSASVYYLRGQKAETSRVVGTLCWYALSVALPLAVLISTAVVVVPDFFGDIRPWVAVTFGIGTACLMALSLLRNILVAQMAAGRLAVVSLIPTMFLLVVGGALVAARLLTAQIAVALYSFGEVAALGAVLWHLRRYIAVGNAWSWALFKGMFAYGLKLYAANVLLLAGSAGTTFLLRHYTLEDFGQVGLFSVGVSISGYMNLPMKTVSPLLYANWAEVEGRGRVLQVERVARVNMAFGVVGTIGMMLLGQFLIAAMYGAEFRPAQSAVYFLAPAVVAISIFAILDSLLAGAGYAGLSACVLGITVPVTLILTAVLVPRMGFLGAACATLIGNLVAGVGSLLLCRMLLGIRPRNCLVLRRDDILALIRGIRRQKDVEA